MGKTQRYGILVLPLLLCLGAFEAASKSSEHFVLVHGAWHGAWSWHKVIAHLEEDGNRVTALDLPSHGIDDLQPKTITMQKYVQSVLDFLDSIGEPVVLVAHSLGGMVITAVAEARPQKVKLLVYVAAFLPASDQTANDLAVHPDSLVTPALQFGEGFVDIDRDAVNDAFYGSSPEADRILARLLLEPNPRALWYTGEMDRIELRFSSESLRDNSQRSRYPASGPTRHDRRHSRSRVAEIDSDHSPFFSAAEELPEHLAELIKEFDDNPKNVKPGRTETQ